MEGGMLATLHRRRVFFALIRAPRPRPSNPSGTSPALARRIDGATLHGHGRRTLLARARLLRDTLTAPRLLSSPFSRVVNHHPLSAPRPWALTHTHLRIVHHRHGTGRRVTGHVPCPATSPNTRPAAVPHHRDARTLQVRSPLGSGFSPCAIPFITRTGGCRSRGIGPASAPRRLGAR